MAAASRLLEGEVDRQLRLQYLNRALTRQVDVVCAKDLTHGTSTDACLQLEVA